MAWSKDYVGPRTNITFRREAVVSLTAIKGSATTDHQCLTQFLLDFQSRGMHLTRRKIYNSYAVARCSHIVLFCDKMRRVLDVLPAVP